MSSNCASHGKKQQQAANNMFAFLSSHMQLYGQPPVVSLISASTQTNQQIQYEQV